MVVREIKKGIHYVGSIDWDRRLFDGLIPLPEGTTYNSYLIQGSNKTALIDTVDPTKEKELFKSLKYLRIKKIDYVVSNHAEQDHSGTLLKVLEKYPGAELVTNEKCKEFLKELLLIPEDRFKIIGNGEKISLGDRTLEFIITPWVHWPETMMTYLPEEKILFSCDLFGSHLATTDLYVRDEYTVYPSAKRYYAEIMMPFRGLIKNHLEKVEGMDINIIAPSHGPMYDKPDFILDAYRDWLSDEVKNEVVIAFVSMHNSTRKMVEYLTKQLVDKKIKVKVFNLTETDIGELAMATVDASTIIIATPTVLTGAHPAAVYAAYLVNALRPTTRYVSAVVSYGWGGRAPEQLKELLCNLNAELLEPVVVRGYPKKQDLKALDKLADTIFNKHKE